MAPPPELAEMDLPNLPRSFPTRRERSAAPAANRDARKGAAEGLTPPPPRRRLRGNLYKNLYNER